jgi:pimeloyl-ACP methyl ester carboxylesterase
MSRRLEQSLSIPAGEVSLEADLRSSHDARGIVLFAHGSGSSRYSVRNRHVARALEERGLATLLLDLLTAEEEQEDAMDAHRRFDIALLSRRLAAATDWVTQQELLRRLPIGYFGASTGAAAALIAAAERPEIVRAVVSRGGRPDLARAVLAAVQAPTLLIVGESDPEVLRLNQAALARLGALGHLVVVPGATHLFEEPGALDQVARVAGEWFVKYLKGGPVSDVISERATDWRVS